MRRNLFTVLGAATAVAAFWLSGCSDQDESKSAPNRGAQSTTSAAPQATDIGPLPAPEALTDVLYRLADPAVNGTDKLGLLQDAGPDDAVTLDRFAAALRDGGFVPLTCTASDIRWSDRHPGDALATINITTSNPEKPGGFTFPMAFHVGESGWQLSRQTADMLLAFDNARTDAGEPSPSPSNVVPGGQNPTPTP